MTGRQWTREELDQVHPLPDGWAWARRLNGLWCARHGTGGARCDVWVSAGSLVAAVDGATAATSIDPPDDVALPVILASKGMDSFAAMADALTETSRCLELAAIAHDGHGDRETAIAKSGEALGLRVAAAMLQRGTVKP